MRNADVGNVFLLCGRRKMNDDVMKILEKKLK